MNMQWIKTSYPQVMLTGDNQTVSGNFSALRKVLAGDGAAALAALAASGLRGRSGIARPVAEKWQLCAAQPTGPKIVIMNTIDGDVGMPAAATLLAIDPVSAIEGLIITGYAVGAQQGYLYVDQTNAEQLASLQATVKSMTTAGVLGENILGSKFNFNLEIAARPAKFVCREDTALIAGLSGHPVMSGLTTPMPAEKGYKGLPTVAHHAETLAQIAAFFRQEKPAQTKLFSLIGDIQNNGLMELPLGSNLRTIIEEIGIVPEGKTIKFVQVGGPNGSILTGDELDIALDFANFEATGRNLGTGSIVVRNTDACVVDYIKTNTDLMNKAACGKCVMGREGSWQLKEFIHDSTIGKSKNDDLDMMQELCQGMSEGAMCSVCRSAGAAFLSALERFGSEFEQHMKRKKCQTLVCSKYVTFHILPDKCTGCTDCLNKCPVSAIEGEKGYIHVIDEDTCNQCGICETICKPNADAIVRAGAIKPQTPDEPIPVGTFKKKPGMGGARRF